jgi:hypothetical protein
LADLLVPRGGGSGPATDPEPTGNYWLFDWYGDMTGDMVRTIPPTETGRYIEIGDPVPAPATRSPGRDGFGNAVRLNAPEPNEYVELPEGILSELDDLTIATWVNWDGAQHWARIFDFGSGTGTFMFLTPDAGGEADGLRFDIVDGSGGAQQVVSPQPLPTGWQHVAVTMDGDTATVWLNGEPLASNDGVTLNPSDLGDTSQNWIGNSQFGADPLLHATVDEFQIYDRALNQGEIASLMASPGGDPGGGNVAWYRFDEDDGTTAVDASGNGRDATIATATTGVEYIPALEGFASADPETRTVRVVFGGGEGDIQLKVDGLRGLRGFGGRANVQVFTTEWTGTEGVSDGPVALFEGTYRAQGGSISVPVAGLKETDAYLAVVTPARDAADFPGPVRRHEAEDAVTARDRRWMSTAHSPLASNNRYVTPRRAGGELRFSVDAPAAGAYDLGIRYANPEAAAAPSAIVVNGARAEVTYEPTGPDATFATHRTHVVLEEGPNDIRVALESGAVGVDHIEVTPFRARFEAEQGRWNSANRVTVDMSEGNFFASYFSGAAYVRDLSQPDSYLELPVTVPAAGSYVLEIGYSTAGSQESRRAQIPAGQVLRVDDGEWQDVTYAPTQFREMIRQTTTTVQLPAGTSTITLAKDHPDHPGQTRPGTVDLDYVDVELLH